MSIWDELNKHVSETYDTLSNGLVGKRTRGLLNMVEGNVKHGLPMLDKNPQDWNTNDVLNTVMGGTIAGRAANTFNPRTGQIADDMRAAGASRDEIWNATAEATGQPAFFDQGGKGQLKWEMDDSGAFMDKSVLKTWTGEGIDPYSYQHGNIGDTLKHDKIFNNYDVSDTPVRFDEMSSKGTYTKDNGIAINKGLLQEPEYRSTTLHELNHGIQDIEGFPKGGNSRMFANEKKEFYDLAANTEKLITVLEGKLKDKPGHLLTIMKLEDARAMHDSYLNKAREALPPYDQYQRLTGEADARAVQKRMDMNMQQRKDKPFYEDYDVPQDEFIYRYNGDGLAGSTRKGGLL